MTLSETDVTAWESDGFVILPGYLSADDLSPALADLDALFPSAEDFHDGADPRRNARFVEDEFAGIDALPFVGVEVSLLAVHERLAGLAEQLLGERDLRLYTAEAWAKYTGAADYDQSLHRDYLNHTVLVPSEVPGLRQLEMFVYLVDVPEDLGPPHLVSRTLTGDLPAKPNWYPRAGGEPEDEDDGFVDRTGHPELYDAEVRAGFPRRHRQLHGRATRPGKRRRAGPRTTPPYACGSRSGSTSWATSRRRSSILRGGGWVCT